MVGVWLVGMVAQSDLLTSKTIYYQTSHVRTQEWAITFALPAGIPPFSKDANANQMVASPCNEISNQQPCYTVQLENWNWSSKGPVEYGRIFFTSGTC